jgi:hypothetical protein
MMLSCAKAAGAANGAAPGVPGFALGMKTRVGLRAVVGVKGNKEIEEIIHQFII